MTYFVSSETLTFTESIDQVTGMVTRKLSSIEDRGLTNRVLN